MFCAGKTQAGRPIGRFQPSNLGLAGASTDLQHRVRHEDVLTGFVEIISSINDGDGTRASMEKALGQLRDGLPLCGFGEMKVYHLLRNLVACKIVTHQTFLQHGFCSDDLGSASFFRLFGLYPQQLPQLLDQIAEEATRLTRTFAPRPIYTANIECSACGWLRELQLEPEGLLKGNGPSWDYTFEGMTIISEDLKPVVRPTDLPAGTYRGRLGMLHSSTTFAPLTQADEGVPSTGVPALDDATVKQMQKLIQDQRTTMRNTVKQNAAAKAAAKAAEKAAAKATTKKKVSRRKKLVDEAGDDDQDGNDEEEEQQQQQEDHRDKRAAQRAQRRVVAEEDDDDENDDEDDDEEEEDDDDEDDDEEEEEEEEEEEGDALDIDDQTAEDKALPSASPPAGRRRRTQDESVQRIAKRLRV